MRRVVCAVSTFMLLCSGARADGSDWELGKQIVETNCAPCHATGETCESPRPEAPRFRDLSKSYPIEALEEALVEGVITGHPDMPEFKFEPAETNAVIEYIRSVQVKRIE